jgi:hypothetical protein
MKQEVILRILVQESSKSVLRLQRYGEKKLEGPIWNFWKVARAIFGNIFENQGSSWKFGDCSLITKKPRGLYAKFPG